jgi:hypothetical protein
MGAERVRDDGATTTETPPAKAAQLVAQWKEYLRRLGALAPGPMAPLPKLVQE